MANRGHLNETQHTTHRIHGEIGAAIRKAPFSHEVQFLNSLRLEGIRTAKCRSIRF
jgi:hypothetical protein